MAALLQTRGRNWIQESYETGDPDIKRRAKQLRALGYRVLSSSLGSQVTQYGRVKMTMLDIRPGTTGDEYLEQVNPRRGRRKNQDWRGSIEARLKTAYGLGYAEGEASSRHDEAGRRFHHESWRKWLSAYGDTAALKRQLEDRHRAGYSEGASSRFGNPARGDRVLALRRFTGTVVARRNGRIDFLTRRRR